MMDKIKELITKLNEKGFPLIMLTDPDKKSPSVSLTMLAISFTICIVGLIGRTAHTFEIDKAEAYNLLILTSGLYFGRKLSTKSATLDAKESKKDSDQ